MSDDIAITRGSGNVFADLGIPKPDDALNKAKLAHRIAAIIKERGWTQIRAAREMGIDQPKLSAIVRGNLADFSLSRLTDYLNRLGEDVEIRTRPNLEPDGPGRTLVVVTDEAVAAAPLVPGDAQVRLG